MSIKAIVFDKDGTLMKFEDFWIPVAQQFLNKLKIADYFDEVFTFDGIHPAKPNPHYVKTICRKYNLAPSEIIMVGDTLIDMDFAKNSNVTTVGVAEKDNDKKYLKQYTKYVLSNVSEIADFLKNGVNINDISC